ncbi:MAG: c-type cytochrome [Flavobacteriales bacterium]|jgi:cytochrome c|nr:c-type cytochrome [Flavobacteriales bacterium]
MKINWRNKIKTLGVTLAIFAAVPSGFAAEDGAALFKANCAACHKLDKNSTGPKLQGARALWEEAGEGEMIYEWIADPVGLAESGKSKRAAEVINFSKSQMTPQSVTKEQVDAILDYADAYVAPVKKKDTGGEVAVKEPTTNYVLWLIVSLLVAGVVAYAALSVKRLLSVAVAERKGEEVVTYDSTKDRVNSWIYRNWLFALLLFLVVAITAGVELFARGYEVNVISDYQPSQPVKYSHKLHAGDMGIDCKYCHNSAEKSKHAGIPTTNVCMNCHRMVPEGTETGTKEIAKLYAAAGYDPEKSDYNYDEYGNVIEGTPIVWNKAHNMPDHVFFSHAQHVNANTGNIDCRQCHGDVKTYTLGRVSTNEEINELAKTDDKIIPLEKPILTMGWCIECHNEKTVDLTKSDYYEEVHNRLKNRPDAMRRILEDEKVTVRELGGWECAKCHY